MKQALTLAAVFGLALAAPAMARFEGTLGEATADLLLERLEGNVAVMQGGGKAAMVILDDLLDPAESLSVYALGAVAGFDSVSWHQDYSGHYQAVFALAFADRAAADRFRHGLDAVAGGPPDPACQSGTVANWATEDGLSLQLRYWDDGEDGNVVHADLTIHGALPQDANCNPTSGAPTDLLDPEGIARFLERIATEPPSFASAAALGEWIAPYGEADLPLTSDCDAIAYIEDPAGLAGVSLLLASMPFCDTRGGSGAYVQLMMGGYDMFAGQTLSAAIDARFGSADACIEGTMAYYPASKTRTIAVSDISNMTSLMVFDTSTEQFGC